jgi:glycogen operon protein
MLLMGDELSRTQAGNNNGYAQDNEISWVDWEETGADAEFLAFAQNLIALRRRYRAFRRVNYLTGATVPKNGLKDVYWLAPEGREMANQDWAEGLRRCLGMQLGNDAPDEQRFLILLNAAPEPVEFRLAPRSRAAGRRSSTRLWRTGWCAARRHPRGRRDLSARGAFAGAVPARRRGR